MLFVTRNQSDCTAVLFFNNLVNFQNKRAGCIYIRNISAFYIINNRFFNPVGADNDFITVFTFIRRRNCFHSPACQIINKLLIMNNRTERTYLFTFFNKIINKVYGTIYSKTEACCFSELNLHFFLPPKEQEYYPLPYLLHSLYHLVQVLLYQVPYLKGLKAYRKKLLPACLP